MSTPAELYRNAIDLNRYSNSVARRITRSYKDAIKEAMQRLAALDAEPSATKSARLQAILANLKGSLDGWANAATALSVEELQELVEVQANFASGLLRAEIPEDLRWQVRNVQISPQFAEAVATIDPTTYNVVTLSDDLGAAVTGTPKPFKLDLEGGSTITLPNGAGLATSFRRLAGKQAEIFTKEVRNGLILGDASPKIASRLRGQLTDVPSNQIKTMVRTSVNQVANAASQAVYTQNRDVTKKYKYVATLDSRTSPICRTLDGRTFDYGKGPTPPQHFNCRSTTRAFIDYKALGRKPPKEGMRAAQGGMIPANQSYGDWLAKRPLKEQEKILGKQGQVGYFKALSKKYGPDDAIRRFVRADGTEKTIADLKRDYGPVSSIKPKPKAKAKAKPKAKTTQDLRDELARAKAKTAAAKAAANKAKAQADRARRALETETRRQQASVPPSGDPLQYVARHQLSNGKAKIGAAEVQNSFAELAKGNTESAKNFRAMMQFQEKNDLSTIWSTGREKMPADFKHWTDSEAFRSSQVAAIARGKKTMPAGGRIKDEANISSIYNEKLLRDIDEGYFGSRIISLGKLKSGEAGHTANSFGAIVVKQGSHQVSINAARAERIRAATRETVRSSAEGRPKYVTYQDLMKKGTVKAPEDWLMTYVHEMGHQVHYAAGVPQFRGMLPTDLLQRAAQNNMDGIKALGEIKAKTWKPSKYGDSNEYERFAETFVQYVFAPEELKKASPDAYNWVKAALEKGLK